MSKAFGIADAAESARIDFLESRVPKGRGDRQALEAAQTTPAFNGVVRPIASKFAHAEWKAIDEDSNERADENPYRFLIETPCPEFPGRIYHKIQQAYRDILGKSLAVIFPSGNKTDQPFELWPIPPTWARFKRGQWEIRIHGSKYTFDPESVFVVKSNPDLTDPYRDTKGLGHVLADEISTLDYVSEFQKARYYNFQRPDMIIRLPGANEKQRNRFKQNYREKFHGVNRAGLPLISGDSKEIDVQELQGTQDSDLTDEERKTLRDVVRQTVGVGPQIIGDVVDANRATSYITRKLFAENTLAPRLKLWASAANQRFKGDIPGTESRRLEPVDPRPDDSERQLEAMKESPPATFTRNEWREAGGEEPDPERGDVYVVPAPKGGVDEIPFGESSGNDDDGGDESEEKVVPLRIVQKNDADDKAEEIASVLTPRPMRVETVDEYERYAREFAEDVGRSELGIAVDQQAMNPLMQPHVDQYGADQVVQITESQKQGIRGVVSEGLKTGKNPRDVAGAISSFYNEEIIPNRSTVIARTEMLRASNHGKWAAHKVSGVVKKREWITTFDGRQRAEHGAIDGQVVGIDENFEYAGFEAKYPGGFGLGYLDIQCRCTTVAKIPRRFYPADRKAYWKEYESNLRRAEEEFASLWRDVLRQVFTDLVWPKTLEVLDVSESEVEATA